IQSEDRAIVIAGYVAVPAVHLRVDGSILGDGGTTLPRKAAAVGGKRNNVLLRAAKIDGIERIRITAAPIHRRRVDDRTADIDRAHLRIRRKKFHGRNSLGIAIRLAYKSQIACAIDGENVAISAEARRKYAFVCGGFFRPVKAAAHRAASTGDRD